MSLLITGSSRGIGRAIALELSRRGYGVAVKYVASKEAAEEVVREIVATGGKAIAVQGNVARAEDLARLIEATLTPARDLSLPHACLDLGGMESQASRDDRGIDAELAVFKPHRIHCR